VQPRPKLAPVWLIALASLILLGGAVGLFVVAAGNRADDVGRHPGTVRVSGCTWLRDNLHGAASYTCTGNFSAADGSFTVPSVTLDHQGELHDDDTVTARVAGPRATVAIETDEVWYRFWVPLAIGVILVGVVGYALRTWLRARIRSKTHHDRA
jgi:hypothetical protein